MVVSPTAVTPSMVADFVRCARGNWFEDQGVESGAFEDGESAVYLADNTDLPGAYEEAELATLRAMLGAEPQSCMELSVGHSKDSLALAWKIAHRMIAVWGGVIDDCRGNFWAAGSPIPTER